MQNPFTTTFSKAPQYTYIATEETDEILDNFRYDYPSESVYKITGVRGSGKTVILAKIEEVLQSEEASANGWLVFDLNPNRDMLGQVAAMLHKEGYGGQDEKTSEVSLSASVFGTGGGFSRAIETENRFFDIGVEIEGMLREVQKDGRKILIGIDEVSRTGEMIRFTSEYGKWLRANYPVYLVCTGLYENITEVSNVKNLTFFRRATTVKTGPLNQVRMTEMYKKYLELSTDKANEMAGITKGYAYAFQKLGSLAFKNLGREEPADPLPDLRAELFAYSYEKIWEELTDMERFLVSLLTEKEEYKREEVIARMGDKGSSYSVYRDRLLKKGILTQRYSYISFSLPFFADYIREYSGMVSE